MRVAIQFSDSDAADAIRAYAERRLRFALGRFGGRVGQVTIKISDDGRSGKQCRISTEVLPFGRVAVAETDPDLFAAIDRATGRIGRLFGRHLDRIRDARLGRQSIRVAA